MSKKIAGKRGRPRKPRHVKAYQQAGAVPQDPLEAVEWAGKLVAITMYQAANDETLDERLRRQEIRAGAKVLAGLVPQTRLLEAERSVRRAAEDRADPLPDPKVKDAPAESAPPLRIPPK